MVLITDPNDFGRWKRLEKLGAKLRAPLLSSAETPLATLEALLPFRPMPMIIKDAPNETPGRSQEVILSTETLAVWEPQNAPSERPQFPLACNFFVAHLLL